MTDAKDPDDGPARNGDGKPVNLKDIPVLFATIHWRSPERPDGYTAEEVWQLNYDGNAHRPDIQKKMLEARDRERAEREDEAE